MKIILTSFQYGASKRSLVGITKFGVRKMIASYTRWRTMVVAKYPIIDARITASFIFLSSNSSVQIVVMPILMVRRSSFSFSLSSSIFQYKIKRVISSQTFELNSKISVGAYTRTRTHQSDREREK